jgi:hypothetical protein
MGWEGKSNLMPFPKNKLRIGNSRVL